MKYIDEYRDPERAQGLIRGIFKLAAQLDRNVQLMEVCGSHTNAIGQHGIRALLPKNVRLISGPGCPVCVTAVDDIDRALWLAEQSDVIFTTFGDMLKVPGTNGKSLQKIRAKGADIRIVGSPLDSLPLAATNPDKQVIFMGIGFETTTPTIAATVMAAQKQGLKNFSVLSAHKVIPPAVSVLLGDPDVHIDGFICPGHVSIITGSAIYEGVAKSGRAAVITGFEPVDILEGVHMLLKQIVENDYKVEIQYSRVVGEGGNYKARQVVDQVFEVADTKWRGLGLIPESGLKFKAGYAEHDAEQKFKIPPLESVEPKGCRCGEILRGAISPHDCPLFKKACTPLNPIGPCMVSYEGTCSAYYKYY